MAEKKYDVFIDGKGYRLAEGQSSFTTNIATPFAPKQVTGDYSLSDFDLYSIVAQKDFRGGIGQLELNDTTKTLWAYRVDTRGERVTLGVKMDSTQPDSTNESTGTVGLIDMQADLNAAIANEPENQTRSWMQLSSVIQKVAVPFTASGSGGSSFSPDQISGLRLWLDADTNVTKDASNKVSEWKGQGTIQPVFSQSTSASQPTWVSSATPTGKSAIQGDGVDDFLYCDRFYNNGVLALGSSGLPSGSTGRTVFIVAMAGVQCTTVDCRPILDLGYDSDSNTNWQVYNNVTVEVDGSPSPSPRRYWNKQLGTTAYKIMCFRQTGTDVNTLEYWENGTLISPDSTTNATLATDNASATLFARNLSTPAYHSNNYIACVLVYDSVLSDADRQNVEAYLDSTYLGGGSTPATDTDVQRIWAYLRTDADITGTLTLGIYTDSAGSPGALVTGASGNVDVSKIGHYGKWLDASFSTPVTLTSGTDYWLVADGSGLASGESVSILTAQHGNSSTSMQSYDGSSWSKNSGYTALLLSQYLNKHPDTPPIEFVEWNGYVYALAGKRLYKITGKTSIAAENHTLAADATDMILVQKSSDADPVLLIALGSGTAMEYYDGTTWTTISTGTTVADQDADVLAIHDNLWWRASQNTTDGVFVQGTSDYTDWSSSGIGGEKVRVGDSRYPVRALFSWKGNLYAAKKDGLYVITYNDTYPAAGVTPQANVLVSLASEIHDANFQAWAIWHDELYFSLASGLARYSNANVLSSVTPDSSLLEGQRARGEFTALTPTLTYLYCVYESGADDWTQILAYNGDWHSIATSDRTGDISRGIFVDSGLFSDLPRVWTSSHCAVTSFVQPTWTSRRWTFAENNGSSPVFFFDRDGTNYDECKGRLYTSWIDGNLQNIVKYWADLDVIASNLSSDYYITVHYRSNEDDSWTLLGDVQTEPVTTLTFPSSFTSRKIQLRFSLYTNVSYQSPQLLGYALRYTPRPLTKQTYMVQVIIADKLELKNGAIETRSVTEQWNDLKSARDASGAITFVDPDGVSHTVHIESLSRQLVSRKSVNREQVQQGYLCTLSMNEA